MTVQQLIIVQIEFFLSEEESRHDQCVRLLAEITGYPSADQSRIASEINAVYAAIEKSNIPPSAQTLSVYDADADASGETESRQDQDEASTLSSSLGKYKGCLLAFSDCIVALVLSCRTHLVCTTVHADL